jgi:hypothetical protein
MNKKNISLSEGRRQILLFLRGPLMVFLAILKNIVELQEKNEQIGIKSLTSVAIGNNEDRKEIKKISL